MEMEDTSLFPHLKPPAYLRLSTETPISAMRRPGRGRGGPARTGRIELLVDLAEVHVLAVLEKNRQQHLAARRWHDRTPCP
jgi:hypothetical protein